MSVLELFSGTRSVGKVCDELGLKTVSVDLILDADHKVDIMEFNYKQYPQDHFDYIWASPPCVAYSNLQNGWLGRERNGKLFTKERMEEDRKEADKLVLKTLEIIDYFKPTLWFIENPQTGQLKNRICMKDLPYYDVDYCMYSDWGYKKRTRIWTNKPFFSPKLCDGKGTCGNMVEIKTDGAVHSGTRQPIKSASRIIHKNPIGDNDKCKRAKKQMIHNVSIGGKDTEFQKVLPGGSSNRLLRYRIPPKLIHDLFI
tara:strand:+ start:2616 stop:3383 length:768 start_codon:yes stop_codon:yes gene_type:complete